MIPRLFRQLSDAATSGTISEEQKFVIKDAVLVHDIFRRSNKVVTDLYNSVQSGVIRENVNQEARARSLQNHPTSKDELLQGLEDLAKQKCLTSGLAELIAACINAENDDDVGESLGNLEQAIKIREEELKDRREEIRRKKQTIDASTDEIELARKAQAKMLERLRIKFDQDQDQEEKEQDSKDADHKSGPVPPSSRGRDTESIPAGKRRKSRSRTPVRSRPIDWAHRISKFTFADREEFVSRAAKGDLEFVKERVKEDHYPVDLCALPGLTALRLASSAGHPRVVKFLVKRGADTNASDRNGYLPIIRAAMNGHYDVCKLLILAGCNLDHCTNDGYSALSWAAFKGWENIVELLIESGCQVTERLELILEERKELIQSLEDLASMPSVVANVVAQYYVDFRAAIGGVLSGALTHIPIKKRGGGRNRRNR